MAYALVGTAGTAAQGTSGAALSTLAWGTGESRTAGNLLICPVALTGTGTTAVPTAPAGWSRTAEVLGALGVAACIFYKIAAGGDAVPTIPAVTGLLLAGQLSEYSGNAAVPLDVYGNIAGTTSPQQAFADSPSGAFPASLNELVICVSADRRSVARASSNTWTSTSGTVTQMGSNNGVSSTDHYSFGRIDAINSLASFANVTITLSITTSITGIAASLAAFSLPSTGLPLAIRNRPLQAVHRASSF